jgi:signal transduction histidine kinase
MGDDVLLSILVVSLVLLATVVSAVLAVYSWRWIEHPVSDSYARLLAADSAWAGCYFIVILSGGGLLTTGALFGQSITASLAAVTWFLFVIEYTGDSEWLPEAVGPILLSEIGLYAILRVLNPNGLAVREIVTGEFGLFVLSAEMFGPLVFVQLAIVYGLLGSSFVLLGRFMWKTQNLYRYQAGAILLTAVVVTISTMLFVGEYRLHPQLDITSVLFVFQAVVIGIALYRYDFLKVAPVAADRFFREMADPVLILDADQGIIDANEAAAGIVDGLGGSHSLDGLDAEELTNAIRAAVDDSESAELSLMTDGGTQEVYDIEVTPITDQFEMTQGHVVVLHDITDRKKRERRLREQNKRLEEFADIVSHDLRNPLSTAAGWTEVVDRQLTDEEPDIEAAREGLDQIADSHRRMDELIEVLLTMAQQGRTVDETQSVSLDQCATEAWSTAETGELKLVIETDQQVEADPARLRQVFENLFRNANDHGIASTVYITETATGFAVEDDGEGIPDSDRESLFEFGYTTDEEGTGIGLAVVKRIIEAHGWQISVDDSEHGGARFEISVV